MALTERTQDKKMLQLVTDISDASISSRRKLKAAFLEKDILQTKNYIKDLEKTIILNKEIIKDLLSADKANVPWKKMIEKLNTENKGLQLKVKELVRECDSTRGKLLVCEQIVEEFKSRENNVDQHYVEKSKEIVDQLNRKEYVLQSYERRFRKAMQLLIKYKEKDPNIRILLKELDEDNNDRKRMTNVLEENEALTVTIQLAHQKLLKVERSLRELYNIKDNEFDIRGLNAMEAHKMDAGSLTQRKTNNTQASSASLNEIVTLIENHGKAIETSMQKLMEENKGVLKLNSRLSQDLFEAMSELKFFKNKRKMLHAKKICVPAKRKSSQPQEEKVDLGDEDFGNVSSICEERNEENFLSFYQDNNYEF